MHFFIKIELKYLSLLVLFLTSCIHGDLLDSEDIMDARNMYTGNFKIHFIENGGDKAFPTTQFSIDTNINVEFYFNENEFVSLPSYYGPYKSFRMKYKIDSVNREMLFSFDGYGKLKQPSKYGYPTVMGNNGFITVDSINFTFENYLNRYYYRLSIVGNRF